MSIQNIYKDPTLVGHSLLSTSQALWDFSKGEFSLFVPAQPGSLTILEDHLLYREVCLEYRNTKIYRTETLGEETICNAVEFLARRVFGSLAAFFSYLILTPMGFSAKFMHLGYRKIEPILNAFPCVQKMQRIWKDRTLIGEMLTSLPSRCASFTTAPLQWHLRADGSDRRWTIFQMKEGNVVDRSEGQYSLVPFEAIEFISRRVLGSLATLGASLISPLGLLSKSIHWAMKTP